MKLKKIFSILFALILLAECYPLEGVFTQTASAATGDPNIIYYKNISVPATSNFYPTNVGDSYGSINDHQLINIQYNRTTKKLTFDFSSNAEFNTNVALIPSQNAADRRAIFASICAAVIPEGTPTDQPSNYYGCPTQYRWVDHTNWTALEERFYKGPFTSNTASATWKLATDTPFKKEISYNSYPELPAGLVIKYDWTGGQQDGFSGFNSDQGLHGPSINNAIQKVFPLIPNSPPTISLNTPNNQVLQNEPGRNTINIEGYVHDPDNDNLTVSAEIPNVFYKKVEVTQTVGYKYFSIPIDVIGDSIPPGDYTINVKVVDTSNMSESTSITVKVSIRLKRNAYVLINSLITNSGTTYEDYEWDAKFAERVKYQHNPNFFDNSMGMIGDSGIWKTGLYNSFPYTGQYVVTYQAKDIPKGDSQFNEYQMWSRDAASSMTFLVHRKPIALFSAQLVNGSVQLADVSYDLDHVTQANKGLMQWEWQYKKSYEQMWTDGQLTGVISPTDSYELRLRVRDVDGADGKGVWSDWCQRTVGTEGNLPPVALFTVTPNTVSYRKATTIIDKSFDPDNDPLDVYNWTVIKNGIQQVWSSSGGATTPPNIAGFGLGNYQIILQVHDIRGLWSAPYSQSVEVINHPPVAAFNMPIEVYRDTVITLDNLTPDPDEDGDVLTYRWYAKFDSGLNYWVGNNRNQVLTIRDLIERNGISHKEAISDGWEMELTASDGLLSSKATRSFAVKNHVPVAAINGPTTAFQYDTKPYTSLDIDDDSSDQNSLQYYWKVTNSDGTIKSYDTPNIDLDFPDPGIYTLEHWIIDQIGDKSNIANLKVSVTENLPPSMTITNPTGTVSSPTIIDAGKEGDPLIQWTYSDPENDPQEKYRLEFFNKDGVLEKSINNNDTTGLLRKYQVPNFTFERFEYFTVFGRAYSKNSWSEISNEKTFIIDNPPQPGFTLITDTGRDATKVPIYRTDVLNINGTATDLDEPKGDVLSYKYLLKPGAGTEGLASVQIDFTKQFTTNGVFALRQVVTDSLGLYRELIQSITIANRLPTVNITYPTSTSPTNPMIVSTLTPTIQWDYEDEDGDLQQRYKVRIIDVSTGNIVTQSGETLSSAKQWKVSAGTLDENKKYAVEVEAYDGYDWSSISPRKYFMVNLLTVKGGVKHTTEWDNNRIAYNLNKSGDPNSPRGYSIFWAGEKFILQADTTGLPDTVVVTMPGGYTTQLNPTSAAKTLWTGELYDSSFENLPNGPITFTFTAQNQFNTKVDTVSVMISEEWSEYFRVHRTK